MEICVRGMRAPEASLTTPLMAPPATCAGQRTELATPNSKMRVATKANLRLVKCIRTPNTRQLQIRYFLEIRRAVSNSGKGPEEAVNRSINFAEAAEDAECTYEATALVSLCRASSFFLLCESAFVSALVLLGTHSFQSRGKKMIH